MTIRIIGKIPSLSALQEIKDLVEYYQTTDGLADIRTRGGKTALNVRGDEIDFIALVTEWDMVVRVK